MHLKERIRRYPLTEKRIRFVLDKKIKRIEYNPMFSSGAAMPTEPGKYIISINYFKSKREQKITLLHEIAHIYYEAYSKECETTESEKLMERLIEAEAKRFYARNMDFVEEIYGLSLKT